jgi:flagellar FliL protein
MSETTTPDAGKAPAKKKSLLVPIAIVVVVLLLGGGGGAWYMLRASAPEGAAPAAEPAKKLSEHGLVTFEPFVVNLADPGNQRFLRASIQLVVETPEEAKEFEEKRVLVMGARDAIVNTLSEQTSDHLGTAEGKLKLRETLKEHVSAALTEIEVVDVLFSDFVIQY